MRIISTFGGYNLPEYSVLVLGLLSLCRDHRVCGIRGVNGLSACSHSDSLFRGSIIAN